MSSQALYNEVPQYPQSIYIGDMYTPQPQSEMYYNNYFNRAPQQNGPQQWTAPSQGPQFIYASHADTGTETTESKSKNELQDVIDSIEGKRNSTDRPDLPTFRRGGNEKRFFFLVWPFLKGLFQQDSS